MPDHDPTAPDLIQAVRAAQVHLAGTYPELVESMNAIADRIRLADKLQAERDELVRGIRAGAHDARATQAVVIAGYLESLVRGLDTPDSVSLYRRDGSFRSVDEILEASQAAQRRSHP